MSLQCPSENQPESGNFDDARGAIHKSAEHKEKPANPDISRVYELLRSGAGGGTRTHTPLRITDFESVSSANSDTPAFIFLSHLPMSYPRNRRDIVEGH